jgi:hypothetical protein
MFAGFHNEYYPLAQFIATFEHIPSMCKPSLESQTLSGANISEVHAIGIICFPSLPQGTSNIVHLAKG